MEKFKAKSDNLVKHNARATYFPTPYGLQLLRIQEFNRAVFLEQGFESVEKSVEKSLLFEQYEMQIDDEADAEKKKANLSRALRRAKQNVFDMVLCNYDLDLFCTLTYDPEKVEDRSSYASIYRPLRAWLSNMVQRNGFKYILVPERHKKGGLHCHLICNSKALELSPAISPKTGKPLTQNGRLIYNLPQWPYGFTTAEYIEAGEGSRESVSKYVFKYMGKDAGATIGGRYFLHGGKLEKPRYAYGDKAEEFLLTDKAATSSYACNPAPGVEYKVITFV